MRISVLIPSCGRDTKLRACLDGLARQTMPAAEVIVGLDGGDEATAAALRADYAGRLPGLSVTPFEKLGLMPLRNRMLGMARGDVFLSLNDDVRPSPRLVESHRRVHESHSGGAVIATGPAPWVRPADPTVFDDLVGGSDLIFFDPKPDEHGRVGYRDCFGLNFSASVPLARELGGFYELVDAYGYDDTEFAHRVVSRAGGSVYFDPDAVVEHDHRYGPLDVIEREYRLGRAAWGYRQAAPAFTADLFGRDIADPDGLRDAAAYVRVTLRDARRVMRSFVGLGELSSGSIPMRGPLPRLLCEHWVLLKRRLWNQGLLHASEGRAYGFDAVWGELSG